MTDTEQKKAATEFAAFWKGKGKERSESQSYWLSLLRDVYGVEHPEQYILFEDEVHLDHASFIDGMIPSTKVLIEQKSLGKNLNQAIRQSDGTFLKPFEQAKRYILGLPLSQHPRWVVTCNFEKFYVYDMERPSGEPEEILLENLPTEYYRLSFLVDNENEHLKKEMEVSLAAGDIVGKIYDALYKQYADPDSEQAQKSLNILCVRLVFCLYAEDAGIFGHHGMFHDYLAECDTRHIRRALVDLFKVLDTKPEDRDPYLKDDNPALAAFPYVNGGLFAKEDIEIPPFTDEIRILLLEHASSDFNWAEISPTIFGAVFESTLNPETRRKGGMHYTSIENIHKLIDPLFLNDLKKEIEEICAISEERSRKRRLKAFQEKLSRLKFFDPACGSGNFLTETYICLRRLENKVLEALSGGQQLIGDVFSNPIQVSIHQFYGIEINDFAVTVAKTALWIAESQMMKETEAIILKPLEFLPLKSYTNITEEDALTLNWETIVPKNEISYIMGNPPFVGASMMSKKQKMEAVEIFGKVKRANSIDYVGAWYHKAASMMQGTAIRSAFVSTNSITQGEQVAPLWSSLIEKYHVHIDYAYRTFKWSSEANEKAAVHCVIIGFSVAENRKQRLIYDNGIISHVTDNINPYLVDAPNVLVWSRSTTLCDVPKITTGNKPSDGGNLILSKEEAEQLIKDDPDIVPCVRRYVASRDFINNNEVRYCLWLKGVSPSVYCKNREIMQRLEKVKKMRLESTAAPTRAMADTPYLFFSTPQTDSNFLCIPEVSSERRRYIPIGFMDQSVIASNMILIIPNANLYHFGVLTSNVHMAWTKTVCGRLKSDFRYSGATVYNNFPWPNPTPEQKIRIEQTAQAILDARALYPDSSLAELYNDLLMPKELRKAHQDNDRAVMRAYGFSIRDTTESKCVAELMKMYQDLLTQES